MAADLGPGGLAAVVRLETGRPGFSYRPPGWAVFDLATIPTLGFGALEGTDALSLNAAIPVSPLPLETPRPFRLRDLSSPSGKKALHCLTQAVYFETGRDNDWAQSAVAQVVLNRMRHPAYPHSVCGVVYQGSARRTGCQFSFTCDGALERAVMVSAWNRAQVVAKRALQGYVQPDVGAATHYHADYVLPYWARTLVKIGKIGPHIFYRWTGPLGSARALNRPYDGDENHLAPTVLAATDERTQTLDGAPISADATRTHVAAAVQGLKLAGLVADAQDGRIHVFLNPVKRKPTAEEVQQINAKLAAYEKSLDPRPEALASATP